MSDDLSEYLRAKDPGKAELAGLWRAAIGLQKVDGLTPSAYLVETARRNIEGEITIAEAGKIIGEYYKSKTVRAEAAKTRTDEADIVSQRITGILAEPTFSFSPEQLVSIHRRLFDGIYKHAGTIRDYNITKNEWVLNGDTVQYASCFRLVETMAFDFSEEKKFSYASVSMDEVVRHFSLFESLALVKYNQEKVFPKYLKCAVQATCLNLNPESVRGVAVKHLPIADIKTLPIPLPPLAEQKRIVAKLEELLPLCERLKSPNRS